jgi:uncharacterized protein YicC (UPF0701 family)
MIKLKNILNEGGLTNYYKRGNSDTRLAAKKVDDALQQLTTDKKQLDNLTRLITDLADAYAEQSINV